MLQDSIVLFLFDVNRQQQLREAAPPFSEIKGESKNLCRRIFCPLKLSYFPQKSFLSLSPLLWAMQLYTACSAAAKEEGLLTIERKQDLFLVKEMLWSCHLNVHHVCFYDWHIADILLLQSGRKQTPGISISWYMQGQSFSEANSPPLPQSIVV